MIYFDNAATSYPKPPEVYDNTFRFMRESAGNPGRGVHHFSNASAQIIEDTRRAIAHLFSIPDPHRVIFSYNCTDGINIILKGLLQRGDHVIASNLDHNSVSRPLQSLIRTREIEVDRVPFDTFRHLKMEEVAKRMRSNTKLIVLTHGSNVLGSVQELEPFLALATAEKRLILLDAAQTAGRIPIAIGDAPVFVACSGHKNLYGMPGIGIFTVPPGVKLLKWREGGSGTTSESLQHPDDLPMALEAGTPNFLSIASLQQGIAFIQKEGMSKIHKREMSLALQLRQFLAAEDRFLLYSSLSENCLPVVSFNVRGASPVEIATILDQSFGIAVRSGLHCAAVLHAQLGTSPDGCLRVSPGYFNTPAEMQSLISALMKIAEAYQ